MEYTILGKTGLRISRMGFGGIPIQRIDAEGTKALMKQLMDEGVNYIDTARGYTVSEEYLGYALEGIRDKFVIATKSMARTKDAMAADIEKSLGNLRTDHIICIRYITQAWSSWIQLWEKGAPWKLSWRLRQQVKSGTSALPHIPQKCSNGL